MIWRAPYSGTTYYRAEDGVSYDVGDLVLFEERLYLVDRVWGEGSPWYVVREVQHG